MRKYKLQSVYGNLLKNISEYNKYSVEVIRKSFTLTFLLIHCEPKCPVEHFLIHCNANTTIKKGYNFNSISIFHPSNLQNMKTFKLQE